MIFDLVKASWKPIILIALVSLIATWAFNIQNALITTQTINNIEIRTINIHSYLQNINNAWTTNALNFEDILPTRTWDENPLNMANNLAYLLDWIYFPINFILWLLRWVSWLIRLLLAVIGWNTTQTNGQYSSQLVRILDWVTQNLMIPYV